MEQFALFFLNLKWYSFIFQAETTYLDVGTVVVGSSASKQVILYNESDYSLHYKLGVEQNISGPYPEEVAQHDPVALDQDIQDGVLPARSRKIITATVRPSRRVYYQWTITYQLLTPEGKIYYLYITYTTYI